MLTQSEHIKTKKAIADMFGTDDLLKLPERVMEVVCGDRRERNRIYLALIDMHRGDLSRDWFQGMFEEEFSNRKELKQDFTPPELCGLVAKIAGNGGSVHEPTSGTGGLMVAKWWNDVKDGFPWGHRPSLHMVDCWELSDRSLPFLLLNLSIRGMMGYVTHGDVLTLKVKHRYAILNRNDDPLAFSEVIEIGPNDRIERRPA